MANSQEPFSNQVFHHLLSLIHRTRQYGRQIIAEGDLTPRALSVLRFLLETETATVGQVQTYLHKSPSTTSALIAQLETKGYLTRRRSQEDNRVVIVTLTLMGYDIAKNTPLGGLPLLHHRLEQLPEERLAEIDGVLTEIMGLMEAIEGG